MKLASLVLVTLLLQWQNAVSYIITEDEEFAVDGSETSCIFRVGSRIRNLHEEEANDRTLLGAGDGSSISSALSHQRQEHRRAVSMDLPLEVTGCDTISVDIPYDGIKMSFQKKVSVLAADRLSSSSPSEFSHWSGTDEANGSIFDFVKDDEGHMAGSIVDVSNHNVLQFRSNYNGDYEVTITPSSDFPPEDDPLFDELEDEADEVPASEPEVEVGDGGRNLRMRSTTTAATSSSSSSSSMLSQIKENLSQQIAAAHANTRKLYDDDGGNLDVLVVWTKKAECSQSGLSKGCTLTSTTEANMRALIDLAIVETNMGYSNSGVLTELLLVHAYRHESYDEDNFSFSQSLSNVRNGADDLSDVHDNRTLYGADMVTLIIDHSQYCGIAYLGPSIGNMYAVTAYGCATGYYTFGHEIGHNLGCNHDKGTSNACSSSAYQYGYRDPNADFRTVLAYNCVSGQCDNNAGGGCTRVPYYSNPNTQYNGKAVGNAVTDNARRINDVRQTVAGYYPHGSTTPAPVPITPAPTAAPVVITPAPTAAPVPITPAPTRAPSLASCGDGICQVEEGEGCGFCPADCTSPSSCNMVSNGSSSLVYSNSAYGVAFDVTIGISKLYFYGLKLYLLQDTTAKVYMKSGSYSTDSDLNNWTKVFDGSISSSGSRQDIEFQSRFQADPLSTVAFYVSFGSGGAFVYSRDGFSNDDATVLIGNTLTEQTGNTLPSTSFSNRAFYEGIKYDYGSSGTSAPTAPSTNSPTASPSAAPIPKLGVSYYEVSWNSLPSGGFGSFTPYKTDIVPTIDYRAGNGVFATSERSDYVAALFEGQLEFAGGGESVKFCLTSDDGSKLKIDGSVVVNNDGLHGDVTKCETVTLTGRVEAVVEFFEKTGGATCVLEWERPSGSSRVVVPAGAWLEPATSAPNASTPGPSAAPTASTPVPTMSPTVSPTASPTASPTLSPTRSTPAPVPSFTPAPVGSPTSSCSCCEELKSQMDNMEAKLQIIHDLMLQGSTPTAAPTSAPTLNCTDRTDKWVINGINRKWCNWASNTNTATRCEDKNLFDDCPQICSKPGCTA